MTGKQRDATVVTALEPWLAANLPSELLEAVDWRALGARLRETTNRFGLTERQALVAMAGIIYEMLQREETGDASMSGMPMPRERRTKP